MPRPYPWHTVPPGKGVGTAPVLFGKGVGTTPLYTPLYASLYAPL